MYTKPTSLVALQAPEWTFPFSYLIPLYLSPLKTWVHKVGTSSGENPALVVYCVSDVIWNIMLAEFRWRGIQWQTSWANFRIRIIERRMVVPYKFRNPPVHSKLLLTLIPFNTMESITESTHFREIRKFQLELSRNWMDQEQTGRERGVLRNWNYRYPSQPCVRFRSLTPMLDAVPPFLSPHSFPYTLGRGIRFTSEHCALSYYLSVTSHPSSEVQCVFSLSGA